MGPGWYGCIVLVLGLLGLLWPARLALVSRTEPGLQEVDLSLELPGVKGSGQLRRESTGEAATRVVVRLDILGIHGRKAYSWTPSCQEVLAMVGRVGREWLRRGQEAGGRGEAGSVGVDLERGGQIWLPWTRRGWAVLRRFAVVETLEVQVAFGLSDASATARLAGTLWPLGTLGLAWLNRMMNFQTPPQLTVQPCFHRSGLWASGGLRARVPLGCLVLLALHAAWALIRSRWAKRRAARGMGAPATSPPA